MKRANRLYRFYHKYLANKYVLAFLVFLVWVLFLDSNNLIQRYKTIRNIEKLKDQKSYYEKRIKEDTEKLHELRSDKEKLEKFAREQYLMKKPNEDVFVVLIDED
ncbi:MAG: septum formation initiator family protein [Salinivirgaceae bacterium]|jgi:cell division protein DivIC|nr:septum formation initiator family protein [Salinivirgaceae bacterium]